jgi:hypothetical protein
MIMFALVTFVVRPVRPNRNGVNSTTSILRDVVTP